MSAFPCKRTSISRFHFDENSWVVEIRRDLDEDLEEENEVSVSIFNVPKLLFLSHPQSYQPQQIAIGPYHYFTPEHYEMERYKVAAARRLHKGHRRLNFCHLVDMIERDELRIRAHYHKYINFNGEALAWMMALDASFLLEFLQIYAMKEGKELLGRDLSSMPHFLDSAGIKSTHNAILRDVVMLENQIPLFLLRNLLEFRFSSLELADEMLISMLMGFTRELSPFETREETSSIQVSKSPHLLDVLYHVIVPRWREPSEMPEFEEPPEMPELEDLPETNGTDVQEVEHALECSFNVLNFLYMLWTSLSKLAKGPATILTYSGSARVTPADFGSYLEPGMTQNSLNTASPTCKPLEVVSKLPWTFLSNSIVLTMLKQPFGNLFSPKDKAKKEDDGKPNGPKATPKPPLVEEITIPSVTELSKAGVRFIPTNSGITSISFEVKTKTFYLPKIRLDVNSEVVLRNLVAYEACNAAGPLVLARYTELMNGIIDTEEDAELLREKGIILNHLKKDKDVAELWNEMNRSIKLTKVEFLDQTIADVNKFYNSRWEVKVKRFFKHCILGSWKFLTFLAALLILLMVGVQAFCSFYGCPRLFNLIETYQH